MVDHRILVIEDDPDSQEMVATILEHLEYGVDTADDGEQALSLLFDTAHDYSAVIIDLALPGIDGWELLGQIRNHPQFGTLPCIAVTAFHTTKLRPQAMEAGFTAYFPKPIDTHLLREELTRLI